MTNNSTKTDIVEYANRIAKACKEVTAIWLMGSRINGTAREDSDWDLLVFGGMDTFKFLSTHRKLHREDVDCFVLTDDDSFERAWGDRTKSGSLSGWKWKQLTASEAQYTESKWSDREGITRRRPKAKEGGTFVAGHMSINKMCDGFIFQHNSTE